MRLSDDQKADMWMPLWIGAYTADTMELTTVQHGAYLLLLLAYWRKRAPLADNDDTLRSITKLEKADWRRHRPTLAAFFKVGDGVWWHKRVEAEIAAAEKRAKAASAKASKGAQARWKKSPEDAPGDAPSMPQALLEDMPKQCPTPSPTPSPSGNSVPDGTGGEPPSVDARELTKAELWRAGKSLLAEQGLPAAQCGSFVGKLVTDYGDDIVIAAVRAAVSATPADAKEYLKATCQRLKGERKDPAPSITVPSNAAAITKAQQEAEAARLADPEAKAAADAARRAVMEREHERRKAAGAAA
jgi:uncharacterized protein YdaU (DUF1376 family)